MLGSDGLTRHGHIGLIEQKAEIDSEATREDEHKHRASQGCYRVATISWDSERCIGGQFKLPAVSVQLNTVVAFPSARTGPI